MSREHMMATKRRSDANLINSRPLASPIVGLCVLVAASSLASGGEIVPDFTLTDVNPTSPTYDQTVSPRDFLGKVSGYYFGFAT